MRIVANRQLTGSYGTVVAGQVFEVHEDTGMQLIQNGVAHLEGPPKVLYETKVVVPEVRVVQREAPEVSARLPFHDSTLHNEEQEGVAAEGDPELPESDLSKQGTAGGGGRRGRPRSNPK